MNLVTMGNFWAPSAIASLARSRLTPSSSKIILPGLQIATQYSGAPLPLPILTSAGFLVIGLSGNNLIQSFPSLLTCLVMAIRAASIWLAVIRPGSRLLSPNEPNAILVPLLATALTLPFCTFLYFDFLGCNISFYIKSTIFFFSSDLTFSVLSFVCLPTYQN